MSQGVVNCPEMEPYERATLAEVAAHVVRPGPLHAVLEVLGAPFETALKRLQASRGRLARRTSEAIDRALRGAVERAVLVGARTASDRGVLATYRQLGIVLDGHHEVRTLGLEARDRAAQRLRRGGALTLGGEGLALGAATSVAELLPFAQVAVPGLVAADVAASTALLGRHLVQLSSAYGYSVASDRAHLAHVLAAMVPQQYTFDEGFVPVKVMAAGAAREAGEFVLRLGRRSASVGFEEALRSLGHEAPRLVRLVNLVVERLGLRVSQKSLGMLVPLAGGAVNATLNLAFHQAGHVTGMDYFRILVLSQRYGDEPVRTALEAEITRLREGR